MSYLNNLIRALLGADTILILETKHMTAALDNLAAKVEAQTTVIQSAETLLSTLAAEIRNIPAGDDDALNALADKIDAQTSELSAAVQANTPASPATGDAPTA